MHIEAKKSGIFGKEKLMWTLTDDEITVHEEGIAFEANKKPIGKYPIDNIVFAKIEDECIIVYGFKDAADIDQKIDTLSNYVRDHGDDWTPGHSFYHELNGFSIFLHYINQDDIDNVYQYIVEHSRHLQLKESVDNLGTVLHSPHEIRKKCNVCGTIFCYTEQDLKDSIGKAFSNLAGSIVQIGGAATGNMGAAIYGKQNASNKVIDYSRCPNCNSKDIVTYYPEAEKEIDSTQNQQQQSSTDEILKFKNLLDIGAITQEEFDAKKQQLLGL